MQSTRLANYWKHCKYATVWVGALLFLACSPLQENKLDYVPLLFPPPPQQARVQYLGSISSLKDIESSAANSFSDFILGASPNSFPLVKPSAVAMFGSQLYVSDTVLNTVIVYDLESGKAHRLAGDRGMGKMREANDITIDDQGRIFVADKKRKAVLVYGPDEEFQVAWGKNIAPVAVAVAGEYLYVSNIEKHQIEVLNRKNGTLIQTIGVKGNALGKFAYPTHLATDNQNNLYVTDTGNFRVQKFSPSGAVLKQFGGLGADLGKFSWPKGVGVDKHGRLYVADSRFANVQVFDKEGKLLIFFGGPGRDQGNLDLPSGVFVCDWPDLSWLNNRLLDGFEPESLCIVVNQWQGHWINFFAIARDAEPTQ